ncbi:MAG: hypothetical protein J1E37_08155 [Prevotella sp.]|nr:hypothetical protein [Prevotella sp.]
MKKFLLTIFMILAISGGVVLANINHAIAIANSLTSITFDYKGDVGYYTYEGPYESYGIAQLYRGSDGNYYLGVRYNGIGQYIISRNTYKTYKGFNVSRFPYICNLEGKTVFLLKL